MTRCYMLHYYYHKQYLLSRISIGTFFRISVSAILMISGHEYEKCVKMRYADWLMDLGKKIDLPEPPWITSEFSYFNIVSHQYPKIMAHLNNFVTLRLHKGRRNKKLVCSGVRQEVHHQGNQLMSGSCFEVTGVLWGLLVLKVIKGGLISSTCSFVSGGWNRKRKFRMKNRKWFD